MYINYFSTNWENKTIPDPGRSHMLQSDEAHVPQLLSLCSRTRSLHLLLLCVPQILTPVCPRAHAPQQGKSPQREACAPQLESSPHAPQAEKSPHRDETPAQPKIKENYENK